MTARWCLLTIGLALVLGLSACSSYPPAMGFRGGMLAPPTGQAGPCTETPAGMVCRVTPTGEMACEWRPASETVSSASGQQR